MSNEQKVLGHEIFDEINSAQYLKLKDGEEVVVGVKKYRYEKVQFDENEPEKPALILEIDEKNGQQTALEFTITAKYFADAVKEYIDNAEVDLLKWLFKIKRSGSGMDTKYTFTPLKPKTKSTPQNSTKSNNIEAYV